MTLLVLYYFFSTMFCLGAMIEHTEQDEFIKTNVTLVKVAAAILCGWCITPMLLGSCTECIIRQEKKDKSKF